MARRTGLRFVDYDRLVREVAFKLDGATESYRAQIREVEDDLERAMPVTLNAAKDGVTRAFADELVQYILRCVRPALLEKLTVEGKPRP